MRYIPTEARCVFVDGPVAVYIHEAPKEEILAAYARLERIVQVAAKNLDKPEKETLNDLRG